jgi:aminopeptidase N
MDQPIPSYLMALAVGDVEFRSLGDRTGVYAIPSLIDAAAYEFEDMQKMLVAAEKLYGPYVWGRYDVLVLPPAFPFGGMENPKLTFATPTIIAGDKSLVSLIAHELAHSWSGNLVTNSTWDDFWINEGFTVYFEERIMEEVFGREYSEMLAQLSRQELDATISEISAVNEKDTWLKLSLENRNPDDAMTDIAYNKGYFFLFLPIFW